MVVDDFFRGNRHWRRARLDEDADFFQRFASGQSPGSFWICCSDSRSSPELFCGAGTGEFFVYRTIANIVDPDDVGLLAALDYAMNALCVPVVVICGHDLCGGVAAAASPPTGGAIDACIAGLRRLADRHGDELAAIEDMGARRRRLSELNVADGVRAVSSSSSVRSARRERRVEVHGLFYEPQSGRLLDLGVSDKG